MPDLLSSNSMRRDQGDQSQSTSSRILCSDRQLLLKAPFLQTSIRRRSNTRDARVLLAATNFISPSDPIYLELGSSAQITAHPRSCENYPVLGTHFQLRQTRLLVGRSRLIEVEAYGARSQGKHPCKNAQVKPSQAPSNSQ